MKYEDTRILEYSILSLFLTSLLMTFFTLELFFMRFTIFSGVMVSILLLFEINIYPNSEVKNIKSSVMLIYLNLKYMIQKPKNKT